MHTHCFFVTIKLGDIMKEKYVIFIVLASALGIDSVLIQSIFFDGTAYSLMNGIEIFKYFTLQSNLIVFFYFAFLYLGKYKDNTLFDRLIGGVVIYITITFFVFAIFIEPVVSPKGFGLVGSILNHYVTPVLVIGFMVRFREDYFFSNKDIKLWIIYPAIYLVFLLTLGMLTNDYLYPFFQVEEVGFIGLSISVVSIIILFLFLSFSFVKIVSKKENALS